MTLVYRIKNLLHPLEDTKYLYEGDNVRTLWDKQRHIVTWELFGAVNDEDWQKSLIKGAEETVKHRRGFWLNKTKHLKDCTAPQLNFVQEKMSDFIEEKGLEKLFVAFISPLNWEDACQVSMYRLYTSMYYSPMIETEQFKSEENAVQWLLLKKDGEKNG